MRRSSPGGASAGASSRTVALDAIRRVIDEGAYSNRLLPILLSRSGLDTRDRAFAAELAYGTLRRRLRLDHAIETAARRPIARITPLAAHALRLGAYQVLEAGVAPHAAVSETVDLVGPRERGFVNAVLRRLATGAPSLPDGDDADAVSVRTGLVPWAVRELRAVVGEEAEAAAGALADRAPLTLRAIGDRTELLGRLEATGLDARLAPHDPACLLLDGGDPTAFPGFDDGAFAIQDQASALVVRALDLRPGGRVLDVCAAPGGKALFARALVGPEGTVVAADVRPRRMRPIAREATRLGVRPLALVQDAIHPAVTGTFDRVLVDAPCSGIGSARRRPELLWRVARERLPELASRQLAILEASAAFVAPGGRLLYAVCTFPRAETDAVVETFLGTRVARDLRLAPAPTDAPDGAAERHRLWPHRLGTDGMFFAALDRPA